MGFKEVQDLDCATTVALGGKDKNGKPNPKSIEGYYLGFREVVSKLSKTGLAKVHVFQTSNGNVGVWGKTNLDQKLATALVGAMTRVTFTGIQPIPGKKGMFKYKVELDAENSVDVSNFSNAAAADDEEEAAAEDTSYEAEEYEESEPGEEEAAADEVTPVRASPPKQTAVAPDAARQAKVKALLGGNRTTKTNA